MQPPPRLIYMAALSGDEPAGGSSESMFSGLSPCEGLLGAVAEVDVDGGDAVVTLTLTLTLGLLPCEGLLGAVAEVGVDGGDAVVTLTLTPGLSPCEGLLGAVAEVDVDGGDAVVEREAALHRAVLHKRVDRVVRPVVAQQRRHVALSDDTRFIYYTCVTIT